MPIPPTHAVADPQVRAVLDALSRNVQITIDSIQATATVEQAPQVGGATTFGSPSSTTNITNFGGAYTVQNLKDDLVSGAITAVSGARNSDSIIKTAATYMSFQHKDASILGTTAAYSGDFRTALGITSTGIIAGYNNKSTGAWQTTLAIEAATGNLTVLGTIKANSVIQTGAYLGSQTVSSVLTDVSNASSDAASALSQVSSKLSASSSYTLAGVVSVTNTGGIQAGSVTWNSSTGVVTGGSGVVLTENGITGVKSGVVTFSIDNTGNAVFSGDINTGGDAYFEGQAATSYQVIIDGTPFYLDYSVFGVGATSAGTNARVGLLGRANSVNSAWNVGVLGTASGGFYNNNAVGVVGVGFYGGSFTSDSTSGAGIVVAAATTTSTAISIGKGYLTYNGVAVLPPDGGTDKYLRNDGTWVSIGAIGGGTVSRVRGTGTVSGISLSGDVSTDGFLTLGGSLSLTSGNVTGALGYTPYNSSNPSGYITSSTSSLTNYSTTSDTLAYLASFGKSFSASCTFPGVGFSVSGSGTNNVGYTIFQTSDRSLKKDITPNTLGMDFIRQLNPVTYYYLDDSLFGFKKKMYGLIANDVMDVAGEESSLVYTTGSGPLEGKLAADYASYVAPIITALKEIDARLAQLEANNA